MGKEPKKLAWWYVIQEIWNQNHAARKEKQTMFRSKKQQTASPELACWGRSLKALRKDSPYFALTRWSQACCDYPQMKKSYFCHSKTLVSEGGSLNEPWEGKCYHMNIPYTLFLREGSKDHFPISRITNCHFYRSLRRMIFQNQFRVRAFGISFNKLENSVNFHPSIQSANIFTNSKGKTKLN